MARFVPGQEAAAAFFLCAPAPPPTVNRVLVVSGTPMLLTDQTLEVLDPETFASTSVTNHLSRGRYGWEGTLVAHRDQGGVAATAPPPRCRLSPVRRARGGAVRQARGWWRWSP